MNADNTTPKTPPPATLTKPSPARLALTRPDEHIYEELSRVHHELANLQSELARTKAELAAAQEKLEASEKRYRNLTEGSPITERKQAESQLRKLSRAVEQCPVSIVITNLQGEIEYVNPKFCAVTGYSFEAVRGKNPRVLKSGEMPAEGYRQLWAKITAGEEWHGEFHNRKKNGELYWESASISPIRDDTGKVTHFVAVKEDITQRKREAALLLDSQQRLALATESARIGIWDWDLVANHRVWDAQMFLLYSVREPDYANSFAAWQKLLHPDDRDRVVADMLNTLAGAKDYHTEFRVVWPNGEVHYLEAHGLVIRAEDGSATRMIGVNWDITERKQVEERLRQNEVRIRAITDSAQDAILRMDPEGRISFWNPAAQRILGYTSAEALGQNLHELIVPARFHAAHHAAYPAFRQKGQGAAIGKTLDLEACRKDGREISVQLSLSAVQMDGGWHAVAIIRDITERKQAEEAMRKIEMQLAHAMSLAQLVEWEYDVASGSFTFNDRYYALHGTSAELEGGNRISAEAFARRFVHPDDAHLVADEVAKCAAAADPNYVSEVECRILRRDGDVRHVLAHIAVVKDATGRTIQLRGANQDITERKQAQAEREKLERQVAEHKVKEESARLALEHELKSSQLQNRFVSMVSHEFRTPLSVINMAAELLNGYWDKMTREEQAEHLQEIQSSVGRMTQMMNDFLIHGNCARGKTECQPSRVEVTALCGQIIAEVASQINPPRAIECTIDPAVDQAWLDEKILGHILGNLLSNAVKYSNQDQSVKLEVKQVAGSPEPNGGADSSPGTHLESKVTDSPATRNPQPSTASSEPRLEFKVTDSGIGIPAADMAKLFQTFHRAANVGNRPGTGMGLAIVKQFVDLHQGTIRVESKEGKGTTVWVELPIAAPAAPAEEYI